VRPEASAIENGGENMSAMIHPSAEVKTAAIGERTRIWQHCVVLEGAAIGADCNINLNCFVENDVVIGDRVTLKCGVYLWDGIRVEDDVFIGPNATFTNDRHPRSKARPAAFDRTLIRRGASIGAAAVVVGPVTIGEYGLIGAGAVVTRDVPPHTLWVGVPARCIGYVCRCARRLDPGAACTSCGYSAPDAKKKTEHKKRKKQKEKKQKEKSAGF
jgi:acetyltransferase-like isoleucine patch superfamily enzyme